MEKYHGLIWLVIGGIYAYNFPRFSLAVLLVVFVAVTIANHSEKKHREATFREAKRREQEQEQQPR